jgi:hypothetical protein
MGVSEDSLSRYHEEYVRSKENSGNKS